MFLAPPNDELRLDIVLPGDRYIYIRAASREERQRWLIALGNSRRDNPQHSGIKYRNCIIIYDLCPATWITIVLVRYMKVMELHWQCQKVITHVTNLRRFMQSHNYDDKVNIVNITVFRSDQYFGAGLTEDGTIVE